MRTLVRLTDVTTTCVDVIIRVKVNKVSLHSGAICYLFNKLKLVFQSIEWTSFVI